MADSPGTTMVLRTRTSQFLGVAMVVAAAVALLSAVIDGPDALLRYAAPSVLFAVLGWGAFWAPHVEISDGGVRIANTLRTIQVPWPAIAGVNGRYGLRLDTAYGGFTAWSAGAPAGRDRTKRPVSEAAALVEARLADLRAAGWLEDPRLERPEPLVSWHLPLITAVVVLGLATVALPLLP